MRKKYSSVRKHFYLGCTAVLIAAAVVFCGCERKTDSYNVFSNGTAVEVGIEQPSQSKKTDSADFYIPEGMDNDYVSKNFLNDEEREYYTQLLKDLGTFKEKVPLMIDGMEYGKLLNVLRQEQLAYTQVAGWDWEFNTERQGFDIVFRYRFTADEISSMNLASERAAKEIMKNVTDDMDDYQKLKYFHDYLVLNCDTDQNDEYADTIYGALVRKKALCEGYAKAFSYLCNLAGIENIIITGEASVPHMWNMVKLGGNWYHVDITWDNPNDKLHEDYPDVILYQYFMVTDSVIENNHVIYTYPFEPPKANGKNENYFIREGTDITDEEEFLTASENAIISAVSKGEQSAMVKFETNDLFISISSEISNRSINEIFDPIISKVTSTYGKNIKLSYTDYYEQYRILTYIIEYD